MLLLACLFDCVAVAALWTSLLCYYVLHKTRAVAAIKTESQC